MQSPRLISGGVLALMGVWILMYFRSSAPKSELSSEGLKESKKPIPKVEKTAPAPVPQMAQPMTEKEIHELEVFLSDESFLQVEETLFIDGLPLVRVLGDKVTKDPVTGVLTITGVTKLLLLDGSYVEMSPDGYVTHDPATGKTQAEAAHTKFVPVKKPDEK